MKGIRVIAAFFLWLGAGALWAQEKIVVGGSGALRTEMEQIAKAYMAKNPSDIIEVLPQSMSSSGGIDGVKAGRLAIGMVNRPLLDNERGGIAYRAIARGPVGVGVHKSFPVSNLTETQVCDIFSGKIKSWREVGGGESKIIVLARPAHDDGNTRIMRSQMACFRDVKITSEAIVLVRGGELLDAINRRPGTVGLVNVGSDFSGRENIKAVAIGGALPSVEALQNGKYRYTSDSGIVTLGEPQGLAKRFLEFVVGPEGQRVLARSGMVVVR